MAGKTTTIKAILGLVLKDAGSIKLLGKEISKNERELKNHIGLVLDEGYFYEEMTLKEMKSVIAPAYIVQYGVIMNSFLITSDEVRKK